jgi:hypothetical protein
MKNLLLNIVRLIGFAVAIFGLINLFILLYDADPTEEHKMLLFLVIAGVGTVLFIGVYTYEALKDDSWKPTEEELAKAVRAHARASLKQKLKDGDRAYVGDIYENQN